MKLGWLPKTTPTLRKGTHHSISTFCPRHHQPRVREVFFIILGSVHVGAPALHLPSIEADGRVNGDCVGPLGLFG